MWYTTGPLNNLTVFDKTVSKYVIVNAINNNPKRSAVIRIRIYALNGQKKLIISKRFLLKPRSSSFNILNVSRTMQYEVQFQSSLPQVLFASFGVSPQDRFVASHRVLNKELTRIPC